MKTKVKQKASVFDSSRDILVYNVYGSNLIFNTNSNHWGEIKIHKGKLIRRSFPQGYLEIELSKEFSEKHRFQKGRRLLNLKTGAWMYHTFQSVSTEEAQELEELLEEGFSKAYHNSKESLKIHLEKEDKTYNDCLRIAFPYKNN